MPKRMIGVDVFSAGFDRLRSLYAAGHRVVVSFSAGKDSGVCLELARMAARDTGRLPVEVFMIDEEIMLPGTFEYAERVAADPDFAFSWQYTRMPMVNAFNRQDPYWWIFDPDLDPEQWVRQPPAIAQETGETNVYYMVTSKTHPPAEGKQLYTVIGLRASESRGRYMGVFSSGGWLTKEKPGTGAIHARPIYDWNDGDVWKFLSDIGADYNHAYDVMARMGIPRSKLRIAPPTMNMYGIKDLQLAAKAWPRWFDKVARRCPGTRAAANYGRRCAEPHRKLNETWEMCFRRTCIDDAPQWIAARALKVSGQILRRHGKHSTSMLPEVKPCYHCSEILGSWKKLAMTMYGGDPFSVRCGLPFVQPEDMRPGTGTWGKRGVAVFP